MRRGTTPTITITAEGLADIKVKKAFLTIKQQDTELTKTLDDIQIDGETITVTLTQEETLMFTGDTNANLQIRVLSDSDTAYASQIVQVHIGNILKDGVI